MKILLIANEQKDKDFYLAEEIVRIIGSSAVVYVSDKKICEKLANVEYLPEENYQDADVFLVLGGDGTLLSTSKTAATYGIPVVGVNLGRLGFLSEIEKENLEEDIKKLISGDYKIQERMMLSAENIDGKDVCALNDIIVSREGSFLKILEFDVYLDDELVDNFKGDGVIISTPTGSTAYSLSAGGPIVDPSMNVIVITPICPHKMYSRTIVVSGDKVVTVKNRSEDGTKAIIAADSQIVGKLENSESVKICAADERFKLIRLHGFKFFSVLHDKLIKKEN